jgi:hypothetical protein
MVGQTDAEVEEFEDGFIVTLPDGTVLDIEPPPFENCTHRINATPPPHRIGEGGSLP